MDVSERLDDLLAAATPAVSVPSPDRQAALEAVLQRVLGPADAAADASAAGAAPTAVSVAVVTSAASGSASAAARHRVGVALCAVLLAGGGVSAAAAAAPPHASVWKPWTWVSSPDAVAVQTAAGQQCETRFEARPARSGAAQQLPVAAAFLNDLDVSALDISAERERLLTEGAGSATAPKDIRTSAASVDADALQNVVVALVWQHLQQEGFGRDGESMAITVDAEVVCGPVQR